MKLNHICAIHATDRVIQRFGVAQLVRHPDGRHELVGGSRSDITAAREWASLFGHDIVFSCCQTPPARFRFPR